MPPVKNFLMSGNDNKLKNFLRSSDDLTIPKNSKIQENVTLGLKYKRGSLPPVIGENSFIRSNTIIYDDVERFLKLLAPEKDESVKAEDNLINATIKCFVNRTLGINDKTSRLSAVTANSTEHYNVRLNIYTTGI